MKTTTRQPKLPLSDLEMKLFTPHVDRDYEWWQYIDPTTLPEYMADLYERYHATAGKNRFVIPPPKPPVAAANNAPDPVGEWWDELLRLEVRAEAVLAAIVIGIIIPVAAVFFVN